MLTAKYKALGAALGLCLAVSASGASAYCFVSAGVGTRSAMEPNTCMFMGNDADLTNFAADVCQGLPIVHAPSWNDQILSLEIDAAGSMTVWANVVRDTNVTTWMSPVADDWAPAPGDTMYRNISVVICRQ